MLRDVKFYQGAGKKRGTVEAMTVKLIEIGGGCNIKYQKMHDRLTSLPSAQYLQWNKGEYLIFSYPLPYVWALSAIAIGYDVFRGGIKNIGIAKI